MLNVTLTGDRELIARLEAMPGKLHAALLRKVTALTFKLEAKIKDKLSGKVLKVELRERARKRLGDRFDIRAFHDLVLGNGAVPLAVLEASVDDWIATQAR